MTKAEIEQKLAALEQQAAQLKARGEEATAVREQCRSGFVFTSGAIEAYKEMLAATPAEASEA